MNDKHTSQKIQSLSPALQKLITSTLNYGYNPFEGGEMSFGDKGTLTNFMQYAMLHCNGGATMAAAQQLKAHVAKGGKIVVSIAGALSSFQQGRLLAELIRKDMVILVSATGANHEEDFYRYVADSHYAYIPRYTELTPEQESELRDAGLRRITDTFLPEEESVRVLLPHLEKLWKEAHEKGESYLPHEYFRKLYELGLAIPDTVNRDEAFAKAVSWTYAAYEKGIPIIVPGFEDSTMGNIFAGATYNGRLQTKTPEFSTNVMKSGIDYMHYLYDWYDENAGGPGLAFLQLGGGIAADFTICVVPSLKHDLEIKTVPDWTMFIEVNPNPMSLGSYSGAGGKEKITWDKLSTDSYYQIIQADATIVFPLIAAVLLDL